MFILEARTYEGISLLHGNVQRLLAGRQDANIGAGA
jgi:hypothetical protein